MNKKYNNNPFRVGKIIYKKKPCNSETRRATRADDIRAVVYIRPIIYKDSRIMRSVGFESDAGNDDPCGIINGSLSCQGEELENPVKEELDSFYEDCRFLIKESGFHVISSVQNVSAEEVEYVISFGTEWTSHGRIIFEIRLSDHPFDPIFPKEARARVLKCLTMDRISDGTACKAGIDFQVEKVTVGCVVCESWNRAINRLYRALRRMKEKGTKHNEKTRPEQDKSQS